MITKIIQKTIFIILLLMQHCIILLQAEKINLSSDKKTSSDNQDISELYTSASYWETMSRAKIIRYPEGWEAAADILISGSRFNSSFINNNDNNNITWAADPATGAWFDSKIRDAENKHDGSWVSYIINVRETEDYCLWLDLVQFQEELKKIYINDRYSGNIISSSAYGKETRRLYRLADKISLKKGENTIKIEFYKIFGWVDGIKNIFLTKSDELDPNIFQESFSMNAMFIKPARTSAVPLDKSFVFIPDASRKLYSNQYENDPVLYVSKNGKCGADIIIPETASKAEIFAGSELAGYLEKITGIKFAVLPELQKNNSINNIYIGAARASSNLMIRDESLFGDNEGFIICSFDKGIAIKGSTDKSTLYAVYAFLERIAGVRWLFPGDNGEFVPRIKNLEVGKIDCREKPSFAVRSYFYTHGNKVPDEDKDEFFLWSLRNKLNCLSSEQKNFNSLFTDIRRGGGHEYFKIIPNEKYFTSHPEYFPLINGKRIKTAPMGSQICTSHPDVIKIAADYIADIFKCNPEIKVFVLAPNDGRGFCECENCRKLDDPDENGLGRYSRRNITFVNSVVKILKEKYPEALNKRQILARAYNDFQLPPSGIRVGSGVGLEIAHGVCRNQPLDSKNCSINRDYAAQLSRWLEITDTRRIMAFEYLNKNRWAELICPGAFVNAENLKFYNKNFYFGVISQAAPSWGSAGMLYYIYAKLLWDISLDPGFLMDDFIARAFGPKNAPKMKQFYSIMERAYSTAGKETYGDFSDASLLFTPEVVAECSKILNEVKNSFSLENDQNDQGYKHRFALVHSSFFYTKLVLALISMQDKKSTEYKNLYERIMKFIDENDNQDIIQGFNARETLKDMLPVR
ncbi:MAG: hypothetical protein A2096_08355 [Spirochaetes bacterium GWF1_41_5]|nr:MAG: hypothetical protein A2096_08355 [Spirochaetes bacterium GWF1_41_5]HBE04281.1 hypothetical protein [Spirochaetia bacterium]